MLPPTQAPLNRAPRIRGRVCISTITLTAPQHAFTAAPQGTTGGLRKTPSKRISTKEEPHRRKGASAESLVGIVLTIHSNNSVVSASLGITPETMYTLHAVLDTGSGYDVVCKDALHPGWLRRVIQDAPLPNLGDADGNALLVKHVVQLWLRLGTYVFKIHFLVVKSLSRSAVPGTEFHKKHLNAILCREGLIKFHDEKIRIIASGTKATPWTASASRHGKIPPGSTT